MARSVCTLINVCSGLVIILDYLTFTFVCCCAFVCIYFSFRYAYISDAVARYASYVGQHFASVFPGILHFWHYRCPAVGRATASAMLP